MEADRGRTLDHVDEPPEERGPQRAPAGQHQLHEVRHQQKNAVGPQRQRALLLTGRDRRRIRLR